MIDRRLTPRSFSLALLAGSCLMSACAAFPELEATGARPSGGAYAPGDETLESPVEGAEQRLADRLSIPGGGDEQPRRPEITPEEAAALVGSGPPVSATLPPQTVPELVNAAFGDILAVPFSMGPGVASRNQLVALRGSPQMDRLAFFRLVQTALRDQGVRLHLEGGSLAVSDDFAAGGGAASVIRGRSSVPTAARNVVQFFEVQTIEAQALFSLAEGLTPNNGVSIAVDEPSNALILRGGAREVAQTAAILRELDQTRFAGQQVLRIQPIYFSAEGLRTALRDVLSAEGYQVSVTAGVPRPIVLLSLPEANQLLVFTSDPDLLERVNFWIDELDQPARFGDSTTTFVYQVENTDAQTLGSLATGQQIPQAQPRTPTGVPGAPPRDTSLANLAALTAFRAAGNQGEDGGQQNFIPGAQQFLGGRLLIDPVGNRILFTGTANDYAQLRTLLTTLDVPAKQVLIEVTVAEVTLNDQTRAGLNFFFTESGSDGTLTGGTGGPSPGLELGGTGFNLDFTGIDLRAAFNAFASNNKVNGGAGSAIASPVIGNRSLTTQISLNEGSTAVLGGLIDNTYSKGNSGVPFLKDIPLLGSAFRVDTIRGDQTILVILVTPFIMRNPEDMELFAAQYAAEMNNAFRVGRGWSYTLTPFSGGRGVGFNLPRQSPPTQRPETERLAPGVD